MQFEPTCISTYLSIICFTYLSLIYFTYIYFRSFIGFIRCELLLQRVYLPCAMCRTFLSVSLPPSFSLIFSYFFVLYINREIRFLPPFESSLPFFSSSVYLVSEFLVVFPASRFSISFPHMSFPPLLAFAFASAPPLPFARALLA